MLYATLLSAKFIKQPTARCRYCLLRHHRCRLRTNKLFVFLPFYHVLVLLLIFILILDIRKFSNDDLFGFMSNNMRLGLGLMFAVMVEYERILALKKKPVTVLRSRDIVIRGCQKHS
jgi:hypothetical protein